MDECIKIKLKTDHPVAYEAPDYLAPWGTKRDNSRNWRFNQKLYRAFPKPTLKVLDLGCAGGGFVKDCLDDGCLAVGLEGSDYSKKHRRAEWATIPDYLFTCDITKPFELFTVDGDKSVPLEFDVVTAWEVMEHISECDLQQVANNVSMHLANNGVWIVSISPNREVQGGVVLHQTVKPKDWWINTFEHLGFFNREDWVKYFNGQFVRGPKQHAPNSFHLVLRTVLQTGIPIPPKNTLKDRLFDAWYGSKIQQVLKLGIVGA